MPNSMKFLLTILCIAYPQIGFADAYRWVDKQGMIHFGDKSPDKATKKTKIKSQKKSKPISNRNNTNKFGKTAKWVDENGMLHFGNLKNAKFKNTPEPSQGIIKNKRNHPVTKTIGRNKKTKAATPVLVPQDNKSSATLLSESTKRSINSKSVVKPAKQMGNRKNSSQTKKPIKNINLKSAVDTEPNNWFISIDSKPVETATKRSNKKRSKAGNRRISSKIDDSRNRNAELCGTFTAYVEDYTRKLGQCEAKLCAIYKEYLMKYATKQKKYCN